ncbi:hypothetical protein [Catellatospora citrea]|uniref:Uncharacterized protein n=1 Tax=Catellatospora citrea TaxID=53366 RepID=A0A8J3P3H1_9ACTN|nr:hypothetical protein [Catellatospora citrea]RKE06393.1 hypothetical protein C8E86_1213 [Catellatospora citrea]GIG02626.1 hypothetical protein Cci01nite_77190 [Catellatospora citrea]
MSDTALSDPFEQARAVADAVLYEGCLLYPYRASAAKNQLRWQFGVLVPPAYANDALGEYTWCQTQLLAEPRPGARLHWRLRFLQAQSRTVETDSADGWRPVPSAEVDGIMHLPFDETVEHSVDLVLTPADLIGTPDHVHSFTIPGTTETEQLSRSIRVHRERHPLHGELRLHAELLPGPHGVLRLTATVTNHTEARKGTFTSLFVEEGHLLNASPDAPQVGGLARPEALRYSLIAAHSVFALTAGNFVSLLDPPEWAKTAVQECRNVRTWPVMLGPEGSREVMLSAPVILYDHPVVAPESPGDMFDALEIDELLVLRTLTLTDEEKRQVRATDPRGGALLGRAETLPPEVFERLHGAIRQLRPAPAAEPADVFGTDRPWWDPGADASVDPATDSVVIDGTAVGRGSRVRLHPGGRRSDAQDMFLVDRVATVQAVLLDVDGSTHLAVTLDDDPGADLQILQGRFRYFAPEEVTVVSA